LNDLTDADVLIHVVDASGSADTEGNQVGEGVHPLDDLAWIRNELFEWIYGNVASKWSRISRRGKDKVGASQFSHKSKSRVHLANYLFWWKTEYKIFHNENSSLACLVAINKLNRFC